MNRRVDIREDIKHYQDALSYISSKINYSVRENIDMLPSNMNLKTRSGTVGYNNKILVSDEKFSLGKNVEVNSLVLEPASVDEPVIPMPKGHPSHGVAGETPPGSAHELAKKPAHEDEKIALVLFLTGGFVIRNLFR